MSSWIRVWMVMPADENGVDEVMDRESGEFELVVANGGVAGGRRLVVAVDPASDQHALAALGEDASGYLSEWFAARDVDVQRSLAHEIPLARAFSCIVRVAATIAEASGVFSVEQTDLQHSCRAVACRDRSVTDVLVTSNDRYVAWSQRGKTDFSGNPLESAYNGRAATEHG